MGWRIVIFGAMPAAGAPGVYTARGRVEGEDWAAVAAALNQRMSQLRIGQQDLATRSGVSVSTLRQVQHGAGRRVQNKTLAAIASALEWPEHHLSDVLLGRQQGPRGQGIDGEPAGPILAAVQQLAEGLHDIAGRLDAIERVLNGREPDKPTS